MGTDPLVVQYDGSSPTFQTAERDEDGGIPRLESPARGSVRKESG